jgi:hypothetical protein
VEISDGAIIKCNHESGVKVVNKSSLQTKAPSTVTPTRDNMVFMVTRICDGSSENKIIPVQSVEALRVSRG